MQASGKRVQLACQGTTAGEWFAVTPALADAEKKELQEEGARRKGVRRKTEGGEGGTLKR